MGGESSNPCDEGWGACKGQYFAKHPNSIGAEFCVNKGGTCKAGPGGKADIYYGGGLTWRKVTLQNGQSIKCDANGWKKDPNQNCGCDTAPLMTKYCYKVQHYDCNQQYCCTGEKWMAMHEKIGEPRSGVNNIGVFGDCTTAKEYMHHVTAEVVHLLAQEAGMDHDQEEHFLHSVEDEVYEETCKPCVAMYSSSYAVNGGIDDTNPMISSTDTSSTFDMATYLLPIVAILMVLNFVFILWRCIGYCRKQFGKEKVYQVVHYDTETDLEDKGMLK